MTLNFLYIATIYACAVAKLQYSVIKFNSNSLAVCNQYNVMDQNNVHTDRHLYKLYTMQCTNYINISIIEHQYYILEFISMHVYIQYLSDSGG